MILLKKSGSIFLDRLGAAVLREGHGGTPPMMEPPAT